MTERDSHNPYPTEAHRQRAITVRLVVLAAALAGVVLSLLTKDWLGW